MSILLAFCRLLRRPGQQRARRSRIGIYDLFSGDHHLRFSSLFLGHEQNEHYPITPYKHYSVGGLQTYAISFFLQWCRTYFFSADISVPVEVQPQGGRGASGSANETLSIALVVEAVVGEWTPSLTFLICGYLLAVITRYQADLIHLLPTVRETVFCLFRHSF